MSTRREPTVRRPRQVPRTRRGAEPVPPPAGGPPDEPPPRSWRDQIVGASGLNVVAGIWLIIAPWVLNYSGGDPYWNDVVFGAIVALIGLVRASGAYRESALSWINALIGVWLFVSAFWLDWTSRAFWNDIVLGVVVFMLAAWSAMATEEGMRSPFGPRVGDPVGPRRGDPLGPRGRDPVA